MFVIVKQHLVQIDLIDGPTEYYHTYSPRLDSATFAAIRFIRFVAVGDFGGLGVGSVVRPFDPHTLFTARFHHDACGQSRMRSNVEGSGFLIQGLGIGVTT